MAGGPHVPVSPFARGYATRSPESPQNPLQVTNKPNAVSPTTVRTRFPTQSTVFSPPAHRATNSLDKFVVSVQSDGRLATNPAVLRHYSG